MGMPKWECPGVPHVKIKMGPNWDQHGNAHVRMPRCVPCENKDGSQLGPLGIAQVGMSRCVPCENEYGSQLGPTWDCPSGNAQLCPM